MDNIYNCFRGWLSKFYLPWGSPMQVLQEGQYISPPLRDSPHTWQTNHAASLDEIMRPQDRLPSRRLASPAQLSGTRNSPSLLRFVVIRLVMPYSSRSLLAFFSSACCPEKTRLLMTAFMILVQPSGVSFFIPIPSVVQRSPTARDLHQCGRQFTAP